MEDKRISSEMKEFKKLKVKKERWYHMYEILGEYIHMMKQDFHNITEQGEFLTDQIYDSTGPKSLRSFANAVKGMVWQSAKTSMKIIPTEDLQDNVDVKEYFKMMNKKVADAMDSIDSGLDIAWAEYILDQGCFGTSGIGVFQGQDSDLLFKSYGVDTMVIKEGANGFVNTVYDLFEMTVEQIYEKWGNETPPHIMKMYEDKQYDKSIKILHAIKPRYKRDMNKKNNLNMPYMSKYIDYDNQKLIKESGFEEMPVFVSRFYKRRLETYGRSPAMDALPDVMHINAASEARLLAVEKTLDPPLGIAHDSIVGNGVVDTSAGGINIVDMTKTQTNPIFPIFSNGQIREVDKQIEELKESIASHFLLDRLLDQNNKTQMTLGEVQIRNQMRAESLGSVFARLIRECINPLIERSVSILFGMGRLGSFSIINGKATSEEIPEVILNKITAGEDFYDIKYNTPAMRIIKSEEAQSIQQTIGFAGQVAQLDPKVLDNIDVDEALDKIARIYGVESSIMRETKEVKQIREVRAQQEQAMVQAQAMQQAAQIQKTASEVKPEQAT
jgi:hypothetical protein